MSNRIMYKFTNILNVISNLFGIIPLSISFYHNSYYEALLIFSAMFASILYHLSETSHKLPGIVFTKYSKVLLAIDRICAIFIVCYLIYMMSINQYIDKILIIMKMFCGVMILIGSEFFGSDPILFTMFHSMWHTSAWIIAGEIIHYIHK